MAMLAVAMAVVGGSGAPWATTAPAADLHCRPKSSSLEIAVGGDRWLLEFAAAGTDKIGTEWSVERAGPQGCELRATVSAGLYALRRQIQRSESGVFSVVETFINPGGTDLALWFENNITSAKEPAGCVQRQWNSHISSVASSCIAVGGLYKQTHSASFGWMKPYDDPPFNPSIFVPGQQAGLGAVALDDWMRRQLRIYKSGSSAFFGNHLFAVPAGTSVNYTYALFPTPSADYWDFINLARAETVQEYTVQGAGAFIPYDIANTWSTAALRALLTALATKTAVLCGPLQFGGSPWLGNDAYCNEHPFNITVYLRSIKTACQRLKSIEPALACVVPFETALSPCQSVQANETAPEPAWPDSVVITKGGDPAGFDWVYPDPPATAKTVNYIYALANGNSYGRWVSDRVKGALAAGMDGLYFDFFDYAMSDEPGRQFRYTYNLSLTGWDGRSADPLGSGTMPRQLARRKVDLNWMTTPARAALVDAALRSVDGKGRVVANGNAAGDSYAIRSRPIVRFWEGDTADKYTATHLSTAPMSLGWYDGYTAEVLANNLDRGGLSDFWRTWDNCTFPQCDRNVFADIKEKLSFGLLYFSYYPPAYSNQGEGFSSHALSRPSLLTHMFPITVRDIRPGTISGDERIITLHSGNFSWPDNTDTIATAYCYNAEGVALTPQSVAAGAHGFAVVVPSAGGACVLERQG